MRSKRLFPIFILIPFLTLFVVFRLSPMLMTGIRGIFEVKNGEFIYQGFKAFSKVLGDIELYKAIGNTITIFLIYTIIKLPLVILVGMLLAQIGRSKKIYIKFMYLPMLVGMFAYGIIYRYMFTYDGIINSCLYTLFHFKINWLGNSFAAQNVLALAMLWSSFGFNVMMVSNVITKIPKEELSYAKIEGASNARILFKIILPALRPILITIIALGLIETIGLIDVPMNLTQGGPEMATVTLGYYIYKMAFEYNSFINASAIGITFLIIILVPLLILSNLKKER